MNNISFYKVGDYVMISNPNTKRIEIGRIDDMLDDGETFSYILFYKPEDTPMRKESYYGSRELFKTDINQKAPVSHILNKINVVKLQNYITASKEEKMSGDLYVCRQFYDPVDQEVSPDLEADCFCNRIVNPDEDLLLCECGDRYYHKGCINAAQCKCTSCGAILGEGEEEIMKKIKAEDRTISLVTNKKEEFEDLFEKALNEVAAETPKEKDLYAKNTLMPGYGLNLKKTLSSTSNTSSGQPTRPVKKTTSRKELGNIPEEGYKRVQAAIEAFQKSHYNKNMSDVERHRYYIKEKYYKSLLYGVEEVKEKLRVTGSAQHLEEGARKIAVKDDRENYKNAQNLALNIEATVWHAMNTNKGRIEQAYSMKNRDILNYLMDDNNYELRLNVLLGEKKPEYLCQASGKDLLAKALVQKIQKKEQSTFQRSFLKDEIKLVAKSHKGEIFFEGNDRQDSAVKAKEPEPIVEEKESFQDLVAKIGKDTGFNFGQIEDDNMFDDDQFKVQRVSKTLNYQDESGSTISGQRQDKKPPSVNKNYEENLLQASAIANNRLIDQEVLKNVVSFNFEKTYNTICERIKNHLKPTIADNIVGELSRTYKPGL